MNTMSTIPDLLEGAVGEMKLLARDYARLANLKVHDGVRVLIGATFSLIVAMGMVIIACVELMLALGYWLVSSIDTTTMKALSAAGGLTLLLSIVLTVVGLTLLKRLEPTDDKEKPWQST